MKSLVCNLTSPKIIMTSPDLTLHGVFWRKDAQYGFISGFGITVQQPYEGAHRRSSLARRVKKGLASRGAFARFCGGGGVDGGGHFLITA